MNKCFFIGNLVRDPEITVTSSGTKCCKFSLAVKRDFVSQSGDTDTDFFSITAWNKVAENCGKFLKKGSKVAILGTIQNKSYEKDGKKKTTVEIIASNVEFLISKGNGSDASSEETSHGYREVQDELPF